MIGRPVVALCGVVQKVQLHPLKYVELAATVLLNRFALHFPFKTLFLAGIQRICSFTFSSQYTSAVLLTKETVVSFICPGSFYML